MIPQYNAYAPSGAPPFLFNARYDITQSNEANTYNQIAIEFQYLHGTDVVFMPRVVGPEEAIFGEYLAPKIEAGYPLRVFVEEMEAWAGGGDMYSKFGLQVTDECTIHSNKIAWLQAVSGVYPKQGDVFWVDKAQKMFQISHIEDETNPGFYLFGNRTGWKISCKMFSYSHEEISQDPASNIPAAVAALDSLMAQQDSAEMVTLIDKEINNYVKPIEAAATTVVDQTEKDPLLG